MNKEDLVDEISKGNVSLMGFYNSNGNNMLYTQKYVEEKDKEIERLNNIINELEYYLEKTIIDGGTTGSMSFWYREIYNYLKELKEGK